MDEEDALFEDIRALCDDADALGLEDVALVLEFALDVFLKETAAEAPPAPPTPMQALTRSAQAIEARRQIAPARVPVVGWSMSTFPLSQMARKAS